VPPLELLLEPLGIPPELLVCLAPELLPELPEMPPEPLACWPPELLPAWLEPELPFGLLPLALPDPVPVALGAGVPLPVFVPLPQSPLPVDGGELQLFTLSASGSAARHANVSALRIMTYLRRLYVTVPRGKISA
jgi:hypothetical protein